MYELWEHGHVMDGLQTVQDTDLLTSNEYTVIVIESAQISLEAFRPNARQLPIRSYVIRVCCRRLSSITSFMVGRV
jgi:hypothetical protein